MQRCSCSTRVQPRIFMIVGDCASVSLLSSLIMPYKGMRVGSLYRASAQEYQIYWNRYMAIPTGYWLLVAILRFHFILHCRRKVYICNRPKSVYHRCEEISRMPNELHPDCQANFKFENWSCDNSRSWQMSILLLNASVVFLKCGSLYRCKSSRFQFSIWTLLSQAGVLVCMHHMNSIHTGAYL